MSQQLTLEPGVAETVMQLRTTSNSIRLPCNMLLKHTMLLKQCIDKAEGGMNLGPPPTSPLISVCLQ